MISNEDMDRSERPKHEGDAFSYIHPKMKNKDRAKIFAPFAALRGFEESINGAFKRRR